MKLTAAQAAALTKVHENPGKVIAWYGATSRQGSYLAINGNTEQSLERKGLIARVDTGERLHRGEGEYDVLYVWEVTAAGREALGIKDEQPVKLTENGPYVIWEFQGERYLDGPLATYRRDGANWTRVTRLPWA